MRIFGRDRTGFHVVRFNNEVTEPSTETRRGTRSLLVSLLTTTALSFPLLVPGLASAQSVDTPGTTVLDTIVVEGEKGEKPTGPVKGYIARRQTTATKTSTPIEEIPQSISVVTRDQMDDQNAQSVSEALRYTSGLVAETRGVSGQKFDQVKARGYNVGMYMDGMKLPSIGLYGTPRPDPYLFERLEVLKGPSSVLYGQSTPAGILNMVSKRPQDTAHGEVLVRGGSWDRIQGAFDIGGPLDDNKQFLYRLTGLGWDGKTQVDSTKDQRFAIAPAFTWQPDAGTSLTILGSYQRDPELGTYNAVPAIGSLIPSPNGRISTRFNPGEPDAERFDRYYGSIGYQFEHEINDTVKIRSNARYIKSHFDWTTVGILNLQADGRTANRAAGRYYSDGYSVTFDNQAEINFSTGSFDHKAIVGIDYQYTDADDQLWYGLASPIDVFNPVHNSSITMYPSPPNPLTNTTQRSRQTGLYAQDQISLGNLRLLFGGRYDWASTDTTNRNTGVTTRMSDGAFTGRVGALYTFDNGLAPFLSYSESFQPTSGVDFYGQPFKPTTGAQFEAGIKYQPTWIDGVFSLSAFQMTEQNRLTKDLANSTAMTSYSVQQGEVRTRGIELEGKFALNDSFDVLASYAYLDTKITKSDSGDEGRELTGNPRHIASLWGKYTFHSGAMEGLSVGAGVRYVGKSIANNTPGINYFENPSSTLVDAALSYDFEPRFPKLKGLNASINASNLFDKVVASNCGGDLVGAGGASPVYCFYGARRTVTATLSYKW